MSVLEVQDLHKSFRAGLFEAKSEVLKGISFKVESGAITGFLGANGAGKTTTMKCVLGLIFPDKGKMTYFNNRPLDEVAKSKIGFLPERPYFYSYLTGAEFLKFYGELSTQLPAKQMRDRILDLLKKVGLSHAKDKQLREYSKGMLQRIGIAQALIHNPELIILDEPMSGLDPDGRYYISEIIRETAKAGTAVFLSSHLLHDVEKLCNQLIILHNGRVHYEGKTSDLIDKFSVEFEIVYNKNGEVARHKVADVSSLQSSIDEIRQAQHEIVQINQLKKSLEEYFVKEVLKA